MAGGMDLGTSARGGKKPLDTTINLVPFIDLMAVTISFLIMTAVWTQVGRLQVSQSGGETEVKPTTTLPVVLLITEKSFRLTVGGSVQEPIPFSRNAQQRLDLAKLKEKLEEVKLRFPDQTAITLQAEDNVRYEDLVNVIDECMGAGMPSVNVQAAMG